MSRGLIQTIEAAQYWGEGRLKPIRSVVAVALKLSLAVSVVFGVAAQLLPEGILGLLTGDSAAIAEGAAYLRIVCFGYPFFCVGLTLMNAQRSVENVKVGMVASVSVLVANIGLNGADFWRFGHCSDGREGYGDRNAFGAGFGMWYHAGLYLWDQQKACHSP